MTIFNFKDVSRGPRRSVRKGERPNAEYDPIDEGNPGANTIWSSVISVLLGFFSLLVVWMLWAARTQPKAPDGVLLLPFVMGGVTFAAICFGAPVYWWWQRRRMRAVMEGHLDIEDDSTTLDEGASADSGEEVAFGFDDDEVEREKRATEVKQA